MAQTSRISTNRNLTSRMRYQFYRELLCTLKVQGSRATMLRICHFYEKALPILYQENHPCTDQVVSLGAVSEQ